MITSTDDSYEKRYRQYLQDVSTDDNFDITTVENYEEWCESEDDAMREDAESL
jgi:hypothetical protein